MFIANCLLLIHIRYILSGILWTRQFIDERAGLWPLQQKNYKNTNAQQKELAKRCQHQQHNRKLFVSRFCPNQIRVCLWEQRREPGKLFRSGPVPSAGVPATDAWRSSLSLLCTGMLGGERWRGKTFECWCTYALFPYLDVRYIIKVK